MEPGSPRGLTHLSKCGILRDFIAEELNLAVRDIIEEMERTMADYEVKTSELKQEIEEQRRQLEYLQPEGSSENSGFWSGSGLKRDFDSFWRDQQRSGRQQPPCWR